jgi:hypothetical protein
MFSLLNPPNLVPDFDVTVHVVLDDFGKAGSVYRETDEAEAGLEAVTENLLTGQYNRPIRVIAFNTAEGWSRDVSEDIAWEILNRARKESRVLSGSARHFAEFYVGEEECLRTEAGFA